MVARAIKDRRGVDDEDEDDASRMTFWIAWVACAFFPCMERYKPIPRIMVVMAFIPYTKKQGATSRISKKKALVV